MAAVGLAAATIQGAALALPTLWLVFGFFLACSFVGGLGHGVKNVMFRSLIHVRVPDRLHGRAFAAYNGIRNGAELGAFAAGGVLVALIGPTGTLAYAGGLSALAGLIGLLALLRMNRGWIAKGPVGAARPGDLDGHRRGEACVNESERKKGTRIIGYLDPAEALKAAGLSP